MVNKQPQLFYQDSNGNIVKLFNLPTEQFANEMNIPDDYLRNMGINIPEFKPGQFVTFSKDIENGNNSYSASVNFNTVKAGINYTENSSLSTTINALGYEVTLYALF